MFFPFSLFGDFWSLFLVIFLAVLIPLSLGFGGGCLHESFVVLFPLIPLRGSILGFS
jgi:hypothetical protein